MVFTPMLILMLVILDGVKKEREELENSEKEIQKCLMVMLNL